MLRHEEAQLPYEHESDGAINWDRGGAVSDYFDGDGQTAALEVIFDPGPTGLLLLDTTDHFKDIADSVHLGLIADYVSRSPTITDRTFKRILQSASDDMQELRVRKITYASPLDIIIAASGSVTTFTFVFNRLINLHNNYLQNRESARDHRTRRRVDDFKNRQLDSIENIDSLSPKQIKKLEKKLEAERRLIRNITEIGLAK